MYTKEILVLLIIAYLIGSFPSSVWLGKLFCKIDVREYGSGNAGATNSFRVLGYIIGIPVLLLDVFKGLFAVSLIDFAFYFNYLQCENNFNLIDIKIALGVTAVIGHLFPIFIGFRGGKGIATLLGFMLGTSWLCATFSLLVFIFSFVFSRFVSLSSILASISFPVFIFFNYEYSYEFRSLFVFSIFVPILALITHQKNIERLIRGEENKANFGKNKKS